jgi:hypothetical protein
MKATFRLAGDLDLTVGEQRDAAGYVLIELDNPLKELPPGFGQSNPTRIGALSVKKSVARAIASALMGAASDA